MPTPAPDSLNASEASDAGVDAEPDAARRPDVPYIAVGIDQRVC
jgi:hypothetical protein